MKKKSNISEVMVALAQYQSARTLAIALKIIHEWYGPTFLAKAPDELGYFLMQVEDRGVKAKEILKQNNFKFKKGTTNAL